MSAFLYFAENHDTPVTLELLEQWGLGYAFDAAPWYTEVQHSPSGGRGTLFCDHKALEPRVPKYDADLQTWRKMPASRERKRPEETTASAKPPPTIHLGYYTEARPTRDDLVRGDLVAGYGVTLADGLEWQVPLVKQVTEAGAMQCALPTFVDFDDAGKPCLGRVIDRYRKLIAMATPFWDAWYAGWSGAHARMDALKDDATEAEIAEASRFAIECDTMIEDAIDVLGFNYRIGKCEAAAMELFRSDAGTIDVLKAACDIEYASMLLQKKTAACAT